MLQGDKEANWSAVLKRFYRLTTNQMVTIKSIQAVLKKVIKPENFALSETDLAAP